MALADSALDVKAKQLELKELKKIDLDCPFVSVLEEMLLNVFIVLRPKSNDYEQRRKLIDRFRKMVVDMFGGSYGFATMEVFGSFVMDIFTTDSDLDLSLNLSNCSTSNVPRDQKLKVLRKFAKPLYVLQARRQVSGVLPILGARVPVLKVVDSGTGVECDISVENKDGIMRSSILTIISSLDERFRILSYLMKAWAKAHHINSSKDHSMNSLTIICLVALHLQTRDPPILPPFSTLFKDGTDSSSIQNAFLRFRCSSGKNEETISRLFVSLLNKLSSVASLWEHGLFGSTLDGKWVSKTSAKATIMGVEDFLDKSQNIARAVNEGGMLKINKCIQSSVNHISRFMKGQTDALKLKKLLFGSLPSTIQSDLPKRRSELPAPVDSIVTMSKRRLELPTPVDSIVTKRSRYNEATGSHHNPFFTPIIPRHPSIPPARPSYEEHLRVSSSNLYQTGYGLHHQQPPFVPHIGNGPQQPDPFTPHAGYASLHGERPGIPFPHSGYDDRRHELPFAPHSGYGSAHNQPSGNPFAPHLGYGSAHNQPRGNPFSPHSGYPSAHNQPPANPFAHTGYGWHHNQPGHPTMFR